MKNRIFLETDNIDELGCLGIYDNSYEFYIEVLKTFIKGSKKDMEDLAKYIKEDARDNYRTVVHGIKSSAASVGAVILADMAERIDTEYKKGNWNFVEENHDKLFKLLGDTINLITDRLNDL